MTRRPLHAHDQDNMMNASEPTRVLREDKAGQFYLQNSAHNLAHHQPARQLDLLDARKCVRARRPNVQKHDGFVKVKRVSEESGYVPVRNRNAGRGGV